MLRLIIFVSALFVATGAFATELYVNAPKSGALNLRTGPSTAYHIVAEMPHGSPVKVLATPGKWYKVKYRRGLVGWAHSSFLTGHRNYPAEPTHERGDWQFVDAPEHGSLNLRRGPGSGYAIITSMAHGSSVEVLRRHGNWRKLRHESGHVGWAHGAYISRHPSPVVEYHDHVHRQHRRTNPEFQHALRFCGHGGPSRNFRICLKYGLDGHHHPHRRRH